MHTNTKKNNSYWTDKHDEFCLENSLTPCAKLLWQWILRQKDDEPDLKEFNNWVEDHRNKPYCRLTIKAAFNQLVECRVVKLVKQFTWHLVRIVTRAIDDLFPKKTYATKVKFTIHPLQTIVNPATPYTTAINLLLPPKTR